MDDQLGALLFRGLEYSDGPLNRYPHLVLEAQRMVMVFHTVV